MLIVEVKDGEVIDKVLKKYKRKFERAGILKELRRRKNFAKPSVERRTEVLKVFQRGNVREQERLVVSCFTKTFLYISVGRAAFFSPYPDCLSVRSLPFHCVCAGSAMPHLCCRSEAFPYSHLGGVHDAGRPEPAQHSPPPVVPQILL